MICQPSCWISAVKVRRVREEGRKGGREENEGRKKKAKTGNKSNIKLKLSNFRYHRNYFLDISNKLQINAAKSTWDQASSNKASFNCILKIISSNINEVIKAVLNSYFFLRKDFPHTKSTKSTKSTKRHKYTREKVQKANKEISDYFHLRCFLGAFFIFVCL